MGNTSSLWDNKAPEVSQVEASPNTQCVALKDPVGLGWKEGPLSEPFGGIKVGC